MKNMTKPYIAISYTGMQESGYEQANIALAYAMSQGYNPFSPITHSHPVTKYGVPQNWEFWKQIDTEWIGICDELWVVIPREGVEKIHNSTGVQAEIKLAEEQDMPIKIFRVDNKNKILVQDNSVEIKPKQLV